MSDTNYKNIDITASPPGQEPDRQQYYIARCAKWLDERKKLLGKPLTCYISTFGCQMNVHDSEKLMGTLLEIGFVEADSEEADFVLYNTCTVRENANQKVYGRLGSLNSRKRKNPQMMVALCGCMMQETAVVDKIKKSYRFVDMIFGTHNVFKLAELLSDRIDSKKMVIDIWKDTDKIIEDLPQERKYSFKSGVNIMFGCNNFCSYCIVPYVRGRERSRTPEDILKEIEGLVKNGVVEIMLLGQNVNSYGKSLEPPISFAELLEQAAQVEGLRRIRFMTSHPKDLSEDLIEVMKNSSKICKHLHLPLQSGSSRILSQMNRHYTKEQYLALTEKIKTAIPDISLTTDLIVGFPGETEEDFLETLEVVRKVQFDSAFTFIYSKRTGTPAAAMNNQISEDIIKDRFDRLLKEVQRISAEVGIKGIHTVQEVLVESMDNHEEGYVMGRLSNNTTVHFPGTSELIGTVVNVELEESKRFYYIGKLSV